MVLLNVPGYSEDHTLVGRLLGLGRRRGDMDGQATDALAIQDKLSVALREIKKNQPGFRIDIPRLLIMLYLNNVSCVSFIGAKHSRVDFLLRFFLLPILSAFLGLLACMQPCTKLSNFHQQFSVHIISLL